MTKTEFIEVHPENGGKWDNLFSNIHSADDTPFPSIYNLFLSIIFQIWDTFIASGCLK